MPDANRGFEAFGRWWPEWVREVYEFDGDDWADRLENLSPEQADLLGEYSDAVYDSLDIKRIDPDDKTEAST